MGLHPACEIEGETFPQGPPNPGMFANCGKLMQSHIPSKDAASAGSIGPGSEEPSSIAPMQLFGPGAEHPKNLVPIIL